jgi:hypothetical protein
MPGSAGLRTGKQSDIATGLGESAIKWQAVNVQWHRMPPPVRGQACHVADIDRLDTLIGRCRDDDATTPLCPLQPPGQSADVLARAQDHARAQQHTGIAEYFEHGTFPTGLLEAVLGG